MSYKARIKFANKEWLIVDNFIYEGTKYFYIIEDVSEEIDKYENIKDYQGNISIEFIYKVESTDNYKNVTDQDLIDKLSAIVAIRAVNSKK